jgi:RNA polymerase sigma factor (sigma-70 family)
LGVTGQERPLSKDWVKDIFIYREEGYMEFNTLIKRISPKLKGIAYKLNGYVSFLSDEDFYQEAVCYLWNEFKRGRIDDKTDSYILQGCYFHLRNYIRTIKDKRVVTSLENIVGDEGERTLKETLFLADERSHDYFDRLNDHLIVDAIHNNGLTRREKLILTYYSSGLNMRQVGSRLGVSHVSIVKAMAVIREKCQKHIDI